MSFVNRIPRLSRAQFTAAGSHKFELGDIEIGEAVAEELRAEAHERKIEGGRVGGSKDKQSFAEASKGQSRDAIAKHISDVSGQKMSGFTYEKAKAVVEAARAEPEKYGDILEKMDKTGRVNGAYKQLKVRRQSGQKLSGRTREGDGRGGRIQYPLVSGSDAAIGPLKRPSRRARAVRVGCNAEVR